MLTFYKKYWKTAFDISVIFVTVLLIMWIFSYLYKIAAPIFLSLIVFAMIEPLAKFLHKKGIKKSIATAISILLFLIVIMGVLVGAGIVFVTQVSSLAARLGNLNADSIYRELQVQYTFWAERFNSLNIPTDVLDSLMQQAGSIAESATAIAANFLKMLANGFSSFSSFIVNFIIGIILAYFLSLEIKDWKRVAREKTPDTFKIAFHFLRENVLKGIITYIKAQFKLISVTFIVIFVTLLLLGVHNAFSISILAAFFDVLPLLGVSTLFIPWIIYLFIVGNNALAFWLTGLWLIVILTRQILEPKITGDSLGVSAFTTLAFMIVSLSLFGIAGLILSPILIILIKALYDQGYLQQWIRKPEDYGNTD